MNEFLLLDMDTVLDEFEGIKVTKRLLNENLELDINKLNYEDIVMENSTVSKFVTNPDNAVSPMAAIYPEVDGGWQDGTYTVGNGVTSVVVSSEYIALDESGYYFQSVYYLSNDVISDFYMDKNTTSSAKIIFEYLLTTILGLIPDVRSKALSYALSFVFTSSSVVNSNFWNNVRSLANGGKKAKVTVKKNSYSVTEWANRNYTIYNRTIGNYRVISDVDYNVY